MNYKKIIGIGMVFVLAGVSAGIAKMTHSQIVQEGKYLSNIAGCNDCHTPGYLLGEGKSPEGK
jgi:hypothetical protein